MDTFQASVKTSTKQTSPQKQVQDVSGNDSPVCSYTEWDALEEVIVGIVDGAVIPPWHVCLEATMPEDQLWRFQNQASRPFPSETVALARKELDNFALCLEREGVTVRRPDPRDFSRSYATPDWWSPCGLYAAMPRDLLLVIGDEIIEAPLSWRSRYFEVNAYRKILKHYFRDGARWTSAPRPELRDELYDPTFSSTKDKVERYLVTEAEPVFDAADFMRLGADIVVQQSHVTNRFGIEWLRRHLGADYRVHVLDVRDPHPMHIDATFVPLAPGKALVNPERIGPMPPPFRNWELRPAPLPQIPPDHLMVMSSRWVSMNIFSLNEQTVFVESEETDLQAMLRHWGFDVIPLPFRHFNSLGGSFHCATLDVRRRGTRQTYVEAS
jgi:glycine amidinotransferase